MQSLSFLCDNYSRCKYINLCSAKVIVMVFIATFSNSSVKYVAVSVLFAEETGVPGENNRPVANH